MDAKNPYIDKLNRWSSHIKISQMLEDLPKGSRVLDIGAGTGIIARLCKSRGYIFFGIEPNAGWLGSARDLYSEVFEGGLEQVPDEFIKNYDAIICGDVIEHLVNPEIQLSRLVQAQSDHCIFIISVPNVANIWMRLNLLLGHFDYTEKGILDKTHLHFYTKKTFIKTLNQIGLADHDLVYTPIPIDLVLARHSQSLLTTGLFSILFFFTRLWPTLFAYQMIARAAIPEYKE
jgi:2-polyprenyl-3-methyl-5-hydroxy-6-metoxy-1,4-benzoquinol methylase